MAVESPFLTVVDAAAYLRYSGPHGVSAMHKLIQRHGLPVYRRNGRTILLKREDLDELIETGRCERGIARRARELGRRG